MPEYLSPGVFIEEIPARLKAIEGVSTSTAGLVGESARGPVPGFLPFSPTTPGFAVTPDDAPVLVTSFADYQRTFGQPPADPSADGYLGLAVHAFFDNGGKRAYVSRAVRSGPSAITAAAAAFHRVDQGAILRLTRPFKANGSTLLLNSLRGIAVGANAFEVLASDGSTLVASVQVTAYDVQAGSVTIPAGGITIDLDPDKVAIVPSGVTATAGAGPKFFARSPGVWGKNLRVLFASSDRPPVKVASAVAGPTTLLPVQNPASFYVGAFVAIDLGSSQVTREVKEIQPGGILRLDSSVTGVPVTGTVRVLEVDLVVLDQGTDRLEAFHQLAWNGDADPGIRARHYATVINESSSLIYIQPPWDGGLGGSESGPSLDLQPMSSGGFPVGPTPSTAEEGTDGAMPAGDRSHIIGTDTGPGQRTGIQALKDVDDVRIIAAPGEADVSVQEALITQAENLRYRFAVLDGELDPNAVNVTAAVLKHRNAYDTSYAAYYTPWVQIAVGSKTVYAPPSGYAAGIYARVDNERGVWKAPANEVVGGAVGLKFYITTGEQDILNPRGVNCIRRFEGRGIRVWGARTLSSDPEFRYVNVRRFLIFLEASLDRGTQWVVFEPNAPDTWSRVVDSVSAFLNTQWRSGALFGRRPEDAFFVRCDETTMSVDDVQNGRLICEIGVAIVRPAEFVIFRIEQITGFGKPS